MQKSILIPEGGAQALAFGDGALWVANAATSARLSRIDPRTNADHRDVRDVGERDICCVAAGGGYVWAATNPDHQALEAQRQTAPS